MSERHTDRLDYQKVEDFLLGEVDIVAHISEYEDIEDNRGTHKVHESESKNTLVIYPDDNIWVCHHGGKSQCAGGNVIHYEMSRLDCKWWSAVMSLKNKYNLTFPPDLSLTTLTDDKIQEMSDQQVKGERLKEVRKAFLLETQRQLFHPKHSDHLDYILSRSLTEESIKQFGLGYCPPDLKLEDFTEEELNQSGLFNKTGKPTLSNRITFPYFPTTTSIKRQEPSYFHGRRTHDSPPDSAKYMYQARKESSGAIKEESYKCLWHWNLDAKTEGTQSYLPILVVEGVFDAMLAAQDVPGYTILSAGTTKLSDKVQIPVIARELAKDPKRGITVCFDNDSNSAGNGAATALPPKIAKAYRVINPLSEDAQKEIQEKGWDDPLLFDIRVAVLRIAPGDTKADIADYIEKGRQHELLKWINNAERYPDYLNMLDKKLGRYNASKKREFDPVRPAIYLQSHGLDGKPVYPLMIDNILHTYNHDNGLYEEDNGKIRQPITDLLMPGYKSSRVTSAVEYIQDSLRIMPPEYQYDPTNEGDDILLKVNNGWLVYDEVYGWLHCENNPYLVSKTAVSMDYNKDAECPKLDAFIQETWTHSTPEDFYKICALAMTNYRGHKKAILFAGPQGCGKSTMIKIIEALIHEGSTSAVSLKDMTSGNFGRANLIGSKLNTIYDVSSQAVWDVASLNSIIDGESIEINIKHKPQILYKVQALQLWACNSLPQMKDLDMSFINRLKIFYFDNQVRNTDKEIKEIEKRFTEDPNEMSGLLNKCLPYLANIKTLQLETSVMAEDILRSQTLISSPVAHFCDLYVQAEEGAWVCKKAIHNAYIEFQHAMYPKELPVGKGKFKERLKNIHPTIVRSETRKPWPPADGKNVPVYHDIKFASDTFYKDLDLYESQEIPMGKRIDKDRPEAANEVNTDDEIGF